MHTILLLRHAEAVSVVPGRPDADRPLTEAGRARAAAVGDGLREAGITVDLVLCSSARRTRETTEALRLDCPVEHRDELYNAGSDTIEELLHLLPEDVSTVLVVGHAPGIPALAHDLIDPDTADLTALAAIDRGYPTATLVRFTYDGPWAELRQARLVAAQPGR
ncbi:SixA phosphatase family protein [Propionibacteriaceae bacterium Y2011]|uniref:SixA phosphatase family protein n=1 Tax=Microlunatus sp. Y2014 TaxID=3418488 RepID=UPI003B452EA5